jgi:carboxyl-terminal processing protease
MLGTATNEEEYMKHIPRKWLLLIALVALSLAGVNAQFSRNFSDEFVDSPAGRAFLQVYGALKSNYLDDVDDEAIIEGAITGMLEALEDPYTSYTEPEEASRAVQDRSGSFQGIGAVLSPKDRVNGIIVEVINVYRDGPAWNAGVRRGDVFLEVDGTIVKDATVNEVVELVRGPAGTTVNIIMSRPGAEDPIVFNIVRGRIDIVSVESTVLPNNVGYMRINTFANQRVYEQMAEQLEQLRAEGIDSLLLDLRDNGGGLLNQGILVADEFLSQGDIVFQRARGITQRLASADSAAFDLPMVVLVNQNSASASEIVAGALQDNDRALVVGEDTFGKGVGQSVVSLNNGGQLVYLSFEWLTPDRRSINEGGITPDVPAEDNRFGNVVTLEGRGANPGSDVEIVIDGQVVGTATVDDDGVFRFIETVQRSAMSAVQGEAIVDLASDNALQVAYDTLLNSSAVAPVGN